MSEWAKILISALAGVATGILLEPVKHWISLKLTGKEIKTAIYKELGKAYFIFVIGALNTKEYQPGEFDYEKMCIEYLSLEAFTYFYNQRREAFYGLDECNWIIALNRKFSSIQRAVADKHVTAKDGVMQVVDEFHYRLSNKMLNEKLLRQYADTYGKFIMLTIKDKVNTATTQ
jgi:hypothetical protein